MILFGDIFDEVVRAMRAEQNPEEQRRAMRRLNQDQLAIALRDSWADLRSVLELEWAGSALQLPSNLAGIDLVYDDLNDIEYIPRNRSAGERVENSHRYSLSPVGSFLAASTDAVLAQDSTVLASDTLAAVGSSLVGEYFYVEGEPQLYLISAFDDTEDLFAFSPAYRGVGTRTSVRVAVRPPNTQTLTLLAPEGSEPPSGTISVHYWRVPDTLRDPHDIVPFPTAEVLTYRSISRLPEARKMRPISQAQVDASLSEALALNPDKPMPRLAKGINGSRIDFSRNHYASRDNADLRVNRMYDTWRRNH
jgi:hypothetical protein